MNITDLFCYVIVDKESLKVREFNENMLALFPHMEISEDIQTYFGEVDLSKGAHSQIIADKNYIVNVVSSTHTRGEYYFIYLIEEVIQKTELRYESEYLDDYLDEYDVYDSYNDKVLAFLNTFGKHIENSSNIVIMGHKYPDLDSFASSLGMLWFILNTYDNKSCKILLDDVTSSISILYDKIVLEEQYKDYIVCEKDLENENSLNIDDNTLLIIMDVDNPEIVASYSTYEKCKNVIVLDHHRTSKVSIDNALLKLHLTFASSTSEIVTKVIKTKYSAKEVNPFVAEALLAGITIDTKNFAFQTTFETFETASFLKQIGVNARRVRQLLQGKLIDYRTKAKIVNNVNIYNGHIAISVVNLKNEENPKLIISMVADELLNLVDVEMAFVIAQVGEDVFVSARSLGANVAKIMQHLGGGGHLTVAATIVKGTTATIVKNEILKLSNKTNV